MKVDAILSSGLGHHASQLSGGFGEVPVTSTKNDAGKQEGNQVLFQK